MARRDSDQLTALRRTRYLGSHRSSPGQIEDVDIIFTRDEIRMRPRRRPESQRVVSWDDVLSLKADSYEEIERHVSAIDVLTIGPLAAFTQDRTVYSFLILEDTNGEWIFAVPNLSHIELRAGLGPLQQLVPQSRLPAADAFVVEELEGPQDGDQSGSAPQPSASDRLREVTKLHRAGLLTTEEYEAKRAQLIDEL